MSWSWFCDPRYLLQKYTLVYTHLYEFTYTHSYTQVVIDAHTHTHRNAHARTSLAHARSSRSLWQRYANQWLMFIH